MFNKPAGCVTARRDLDKATVMDYFPEAWRTELHPIGRLDYDTEGLLLITDDGRLDNRLLQPRAHREKCYHLRALGDIDKTKIASLAAGIPVFGRTKTQNPGCECFSPGFFVLEERLRAADVCHLFPRDKLAKWMKNPDGPVIAGTLTITEGKKHQVKLMMKSVGCQVFTLKRLTFAGLTLDPSLAPGEWRPLTEPELALLYGT